MGETKSNDRCSYDQTSIFGKLFLSHIFSVFIRGYRNNGLKQEDLDRCPKQDQVESHVERLSRNWNQDKFRKNSRFWWTLVRTFGPDFILPISILILQEIVIRIWQPIFLSLMIRYFSEDSDITYENACYAAIALCVSAALYSLVFYPNNLLNDRIGMRIRTACCSLMYQKALRLSQASLNKTAVGQIVNIMSNDVNRIDQFVQVMSFIVLGPVQAAMATYIIWTYLGVCSFFGTGVLLLLIPVQFGAAKLFSRIRSKTASLTDIRLRFMHEIVSGMRVIKMYCWERPFADRIAQARKSEISNIRTGCNVKAVNMTIFGIASQISLFVSFVSYILLGHSLTAEAVFVSMALFNSVRLSLTFYFPLAIRMGTELLVTCQRIQNFLMLEEFEPYKQFDNCQDTKENIPKLSEGLVPNRSVWTNGTNVTNKVGQKSTRLVVNNISAKWNPDINELTLKDVSLSLEPGDLLTIIGPVGSGKSSLLMTLLGELPVSGGNILREGRLSYAGQNSWIFNDSVYNNILLGMDYDHRRYQKVIEVSALTRDLELWPFGDQTLVGEKGIQLSGGQKARIELARAVYRSADIYLFDDPLSAVDATVADHIFEKCILGHLQNKIRVLVTHQIQFIQKATKILVLKDGQSLAFGSYEELRDLGIDFLSLIAESEDGELIEEAKSLDKPLVAKSDNKVTENSENNKIKVEESKRGSIQGSVYMAYIRAASSFTLITVVMVTTIFSQALLNGSDIFLADWTNKNQLQEVQQDQQTDIIIYSALIGFLFLTTTIRSISFYDICLRASENLHNQIFSRLLRAPVSFFDTNPAGRIMNRFSKDMGQVDEILVSIAFELNKSISLVVGLVVTICIVNWTMLLPTLLLTILIIFIRKLYIVSARDLKRLEGVARSPVFSHVVTTINGLVSIRAFGTEQSFRQQFNSFQNDHSAASFLVLSSSNGMGIVFDWIGNVFTFIVIASVMLIPDLPGGSVGLIISSVLGLSMFVSYLVGQTADFESQMTSVERIVEYLDLEQEAPNESKPERKPDIEWPSQGEIQFDNLSLFYGNRDNPMLKNLNFSISAGEKVGIVGRTGAGKTSMITALFRLTEPRGVIRIDGVDIQTIGLDDLRQKISIIPQDPVIYSGSIRYNLDPFSHYSDSSLWDALDQVQLKATVTNLEGHLEAKLNDSGSNLSVGQRQLICLARAILRRNQILVLDEATANIDHQTDSLIQSTIRSQFSGCTVLTIAHRLNTIIDSDRVLVLDAGQIVEFDSPYLLLQQQKAFYEMCQKTGPKMYGYLFRAAQLAHQNRLDCLS